jgi:hypothetical protein
MRRFLRRRQQHPGATPQPVGAAERVLWHASNLKPRAAIVLPAAQQNAVILTLSDNDEVHTVPQRVTLSSQNASWASRVRGRSWGLEEV